MKKLIISGCLVFSSLIANPLVLTQNEKQNIKNMADPYPVAKRFNQMYTFIKDAKELDLEMKLIKTNYFINRLLPERESKFSDDWNNIKEFLIKGKGDCEEYAISKYQLLGQITPDKSKIHLGVVKINGEKDFHMVTLFETKDNFYVLDNLSWKVLPIKERSDFVFHFGFNQKNSFLLTDTLEKVPVKRYQKEIQKLNQTINR